MPAPHVDSRSLLVGLAAISFLSLLPTDADAIARVRREVWSYDGAIPSAPSETAVNVAFFANVSDMDVPSRILFDLTIVEPDGSEAALVRYRWGKWEDLPAAGTPIQVYLSFALSCDGRGLVTARPITATFSFCDFGQPDAFERSIDHFDAFTVQTTGPFGLTLIDRGGYHGQTPTPPEAFSCSGAYTLGLTESEALDRLRDSKSEQANRLQDEPPGSIGIYFDPEGTQCSGTITPGQPGKLYVVARMEGMSECGVAGAEFRFTGIPEAWMTNVVPMPDIVAIGDPLLDGAAVGFHCKRPEDGTSVLYEIDVAASELVEDLQLAVVQRDPPSNPNFSCPQLVLCDRPIFTKVCVAGFECFVNATKAVPDRCSTLVPVSAISWTRIKSLFR